MILDLVTSQVMVIVFLQLLQYVCMIYLFSEPIILCPEMSVDSDRDSVIGSEDGKGADVRHYLFFFSWHF